MLLSVFLLSLISISFYPGWISVSRELWCCFRLVIQANPLHYVYTENYTPVFCSLFTLRIPFPAPA
jgi:hypothetical protein